MFKLVVVIPVFQHGDALKSTLQQLSQFGLPIVVVNDGSDMVESSKIREACQGENITLLERSENGGKGVAVMDGVSEADRQRYTHAFQIDADGQHDLTQVPKFIQISRENTAAMILGYPCFDQSVPFGRKLGRWLTHIWIWINTLSFDVRDSMCGFRIYPIATVLDITENSNIGSHMEFDPELCVRACWKGVDVINIPVGVSYPENGKSNFRIKEDNILISLMHTRLFFGMMLRSPLLIISRVQNMIIGNKHIDK